MLFFFLERNYIVYEHLNQKVIKPPRIAIDTKAIGCQNIMNTSKNSKLSTSRISHLMRFAIRHEYENQNASKHPQIATYTDAFDFLQT